MQRQSCESHGPQRAARAMRFRIALLRHDACKGQQCDIVKSHTKSTIKCYGRMPSRGEEMAQNACNSIARRGVRHAYNGKLVGEHFSSAPKLAITIAAIHHHEHMESLGHGA